MTHRPPVVRLDFPPAVATAGRDWHAELNLRFVGQGERTILANRSHVGPLVVQRPFYPEGGVCHVYLLHPPGGIVGGDRLLCRIEAEQGAHAVITTPAATKFYRSAGRVAQQTQEIVLKNAACEWLPQETIYFANALARVRTRVQLDAGSRFMGWDIGCFGRPASGEIFEQGEVFQTFEVWQGETPLFVDRLRVEGQERMMRARWGLSGYTVLGTFLAFRADADDLAEVRSALEQTEDADRLVSTTLVDDVLAARCFGSQGEHVRRALTLIWSVLRPRLLGRPAVSPRIWAT